MKAATCIFSFLFALYSLTYGQNTNSADTTQPIVVPNIGINRSPELRWQKLADSINSYSKTGIFPSFLNDICLDWNAGYWPGFHSPTAVRWKILSFVKVRKSLELLLKNEPETLKIKCSLKWNGDNSYPGDLTPPLNNISTYTLIQRRLKELQ